MKDIRVYEVPEEIHHQFKMIAVRKKIPMNKYFIQLVKDEIERDKKIRRKRK